jgi:hypothetical protein
MRAVLCFGDLGDFYAAYQDASVYTYFPQYHPDQYTTHLPTPSIAHMAMVRMLCIWSLYETYHTEFDPTAEIPYMMGIVMDTHIALITTPRLVDFHAIYKHKLLPEEYGLVQETATVPFVWCEEMSPVARVYRTTEVLWKEEITLAFGTQRCVAAPNRPKSAASLIRDTNILRKGLPRPTSIRYIAAQIKRGLEGCILPTHTVAASQQPCILMALFCSLLGAYKHSRYIAHPARRLQIYQLSTTTELIGMTMGKLSSVQLYNILAEFNIAWATQHGSLSLLLRRIPYWIIHKQTVLWHCAQIARSTATIATTITHRRPSMAAMRRALLQSAEQYNTKNVIYHLYKTMAIRKRVPKTITQLLKSHGYSISAMYKQAIQQIRFYGMDVAILRDMGMRPATIRLLHDTLATPTTDKRVSKLVGTVIQQIQHKCDRAILYLYLHALRECSQFEVRALYRPRQGAGQAPVLICLTCLTVRTKCKGERSIKIRNGGVALDLDRGHVYCCACNSRELITLDAQQYMIQTPNSQHEQAPIRIVACSRCHTAMCREVATRHGVGTYCRACITSIHKPVYDTTLVCGCIPRVVHKKNKQRYHCIVAKTDTHTLRQYTVCARHFRQLPAHIVSVAALKRHFTPPSLE